MKTKKIQWGVMGTFGHNCMFSFSELTVPREELIVLTDCFICLKQ